MSRQDRLTEAKEQQLTEATVAQVASALGHLYDDLDSCGDKIAGNIIPTAAFNSSGLAKSLDAKDVKKFKGLEKKLKVAQKAIGDLFDDVDAVHEAVKEADDDS